MTPGPPVAAAFVTPALFYGGAAAVTAPILIHLLARRRFKRIRWAAMDFLIDAQRRNRRRIRMEEWLLLLLRCLAVLLLAALVARPFLRPAGAATLLGGAQQVERVFVLDDSLSMAYRTAEGPVFDRAKLAVERLLASIRSEAPDDTVTLLRMSAPTAPLESGTYLDDAQTEELLARVTALTPSQRSIEPAQVMAGVAEILARSPDVTSAAVYLISDFQRSDWTQQAARGESSPPPRPAAAKPPGSGLLNPLVAWAGQDRGLHVVLVNVGQEDAANLAVTGLDLPGGQLVAGAEGTVRVSVANFSATPVENLELQVSVGSLEQPSKTLRELAAAQTAETDIQVPFFRAGFETLRLEVPPDALPADNVRYAAVSVASAIQVLVVNGEPSADDYDDEVTFLVTALGPEGDVFSGVSVTVVDETQLEEVDGSRFHAVILANVYRLSDVAVDALERFVRSGGGLIVFLGDQVDPDLYNTALYRDGAGLLPAELTERVRAPQAAHLIVTDRLHPAMRGLSGKGDPLGIGQIPFFEYFGCEPFDGASNGRIGGPEPTHPSSSPGATNVSSRNSPSKTPAARVIARFDDADEHPAIVERRFGFGRVVLVTTTADKEWHQWPDHPTFLPVMMELVRHVARRGSALADFPVGSVIELPFEPDRYEPDALVRGPAWPNEREAGITATPARDGQGMVLRWEHTEKAGLYQFLLKQREGGVRVWLAAVNVDPRESDLTMAGEDELRRAMGSVPFEYFQGVEQLSGATAEGRTELWRLLLLTAVTVLMMEQGLAWWWGRRR